VEVEPGDTGGPPVWAAVLVPLFEERGETRVVLTRRSTALRSHRGEVSFPGGRLDPGEAVEAAAVREADEEIALEPGSVRVAGWLHPVLTFVSGSLIFPVIGVLGGRPHVTASPAEVDRVFDVALADLVVDGVFYEERWSVPGRPVPGSADGSFPVWFFEAAGEIIWGATARMLYELLSVVLGVSGSPAP
jgi:8-oxo-dGTP pyrophosphatase MutT (NUDIX family)